MEIVPLTGGDRPPLEVLRERLRENKVVCLVADRDLSRTRRRGRLLRRARPGCPAARRCSRRRPGASLLPVSLWFTPDGWGQQINPGLSSARGAAARAGAGAHAGDGATCFEQGIAAHPADWHMLQKLWLADLPPANRKAA